MAATPADSAEKSASAGKPADSEREQLGRLLLQLLTTAGQPRPGRVFAAYQLCPPTVRTARCLQRQPVLPHGARAGELRASEIYGWTPREPAEAWHSQALLWQSQLPSEFFSVVETIAVGRIWAERGRDLVLTMAEPESLATTDPIDPLWTYDHRDAGAGFVWNQSSAWYMHRRVNFLAGTNTDVMWHSLAPLTSALGPHALSCFYKVFPDPTVSMSMARAALEVCLLGAIGEVPAAQRTEAYRACARIYASDYDGPPVPGRPLRGDAGTAGVVAARRAGGGPPRRPGHGSGGAGEPGERVRRLGPGAVR